MDKENEIKFFLYEDKKEYDRIFEEIRNLSKDLTPDQIIKEIQSRISLSLLFAMAIENEVWKNFTLFRSRVVQFDRPIAEDEISSFYYPSDLSKIKMGRANLKGQQVFYASGDPHTTFCELKDKLTVKTSIVYLSKWGIKDNCSRTFMKNVFLGLPDGDSDPASIMASAVNRFFKKITSNLSNELTDNFLYAQENYSNLFTTAGDECYHITSAIANDTFYKALKDKVNMPVIAYPSVVKDKKAVNFAFRKDFADEFIYLKEIDKVIVTKLDDESISFSSISRGIVVDNKIKWFGLKLKIENIDFDNTQITNKDSPKELKRLYPSKLTVCCNDHYIDVKDYVLKIGLNEDLIIKSISQIPQQLFSFELSHKYEYFLFIQPPKDLFIQNKISEFGKVTYLAIPVTYSINYE